MLVHKSFRTRLGIGLGTLGGSQCGNFPADARVTFQLSDDGVPARPHKAITMSLGR